MKDMNSQIQEALGIPNKIKNKKYIPTYFIMKPKNTEDRLPIKELRTECCLSSGTKDKKNIEMKSSSAEKNCQLTGLYSEKKKLLKMKRK